MTFLDAEVPVDVVVANTVPCPKVLEGPKLMVDVEGDELADEDENKKLPGKPEVDIDLMVQYDEAERWVVVEDEP